MSGRLIEAHEEERRRIARELHDDICQRLALLAVDLQSCLHIPLESPAQLRDRMQKLLKRTQEIAGDVQSLSHQLHSSKLEILGIVAAAQSFCRELSAQQNVEIDFIHSDVPSAVPQDVSLCIFRVLQEALHNAAKHIGVRHFRAGVARKIQPNRAYCKRLWCGFRSARGSEFARSRPCQHARAGQFSERNEFRLYRNPTVSQKYGLSYPSPWAPRKKQ